ncbi:MAG TPA: hypothetical protein VM899_10900 [Rubellimicrobium sp.]|jgi:hypothetical protein|nr:hypothetical protein [Rubellimicrobium sp.]
MLVRHLLCGMAIGLLAATAGLLLGFSAWLALASFVLGGSLGLGASALGALSCQPYRTRRPKRTVARLRAAERRLGRA